MSEKLPIFKERPVASHANKVTGLVPRARLELARLSTPDPKSGASANFATSAFPLCASEKKLRLGIYQITEINAECLEFVKTVLNKIQRIVKE